MSRKSRIPVDYVDIELGESATYEPPSEADKWMAARRSNLLAPSDYGSVNPRNTYGGPPPAWDLFGGWDRTADAFIEQTGEFNEHRARVVNFEGAASAAGFTVAWDALREFAGSQTEALLVIAYVSGKAIRRTVFRVDPPSSIDPTVIAAQERRVLQSLLRARDESAGQGARVKLDLGDDSGAEEFESLAVLDRRIAECRARIAWFEAAASGDNLPRAVYW